MAQFSISMTFDSILSFPTFPPSNNSQSCPICFYECTQTPYLQEEMDHQRQFHPCMPLHRQSNSYRIFQSHISSFFQCLPQHRLLFWDAICTTLYIIFSGPQVYVASNLLDLNNFSITSVTSPFSP